MRNIAIIDIGSNSIKLVLAEIKKNNSFRIIDELKETVRLGEGMEKDNKLQEGRIKVAIQTLKMFKNLCDATETKEIIAVATAAVRKADNQEEFLNRVKKEVELDVQVLSGEEEGYYDYWGVVNSIDRDNGLIMDIGGGSIELIWMKDRRIKECISLSFGSLDLTQQFNLYDSITSEQEEQLLNFLTKSFNEVNWLKDIDCDSLIGVGGTIRNIAKIDQRNNDYPLDLLHYYQMNEATVDSIYKLVKDKDLKERKKISGLSKKRADIFIGAAAAVTTLMSFCNLEELLISGKGIREGLIYNYLYEDKEPTSNVLDFSINNIINNLNLNKKHAEHIYKLSKKLYQELNPLFKLDENQFEGDVDKILKTATMLHDIGKSINYYDHHEHSFYMILNSGINGLSHRELLISAYISASHRHDKYDLRKYNLNRSQFSDVIDKKGDDKEIIRKFGILVEIAESLDRNLNALIEDIDCYLENDKFVIKTISKEDVELEINDALSASKGFEKLYDKELQIL
ncbi:exopolyphosphatase / guanosine-5'-triphosphate,3'-diphosphate pyrophosphatase [Orenia metallireducens]|jgi:exopolyphosphatase/guanosine-5'-triphosphate,3'-diphosphate pyrophosphatase|uniref:Exopolyphosphatase n=1 Tax=Orenia metallireducens TaxID=1413210 RepID=A0A285GX08_9FIRM|nr:exopolyphosphatase [Orenia metallireducens]SNY28015.1 exopolyphosphatase / guanosine-5'-triphosphate,3'-diphosphate pyrophosphatase [Orenia metallireducens]